MSAECWNHDFEVGTNISHLGKYFDSVLFVSVSLLYSQFTRARVIESREPCPGHWESRGHKLAVLQAFVARCMILKIRHRGLGPGQSTTQEWRCHYSVVSKSTELW